MSVTVPLSHVSPSFLPGKFHLSKKFKPTLFVDTTSHSTSLFSKQRGHTNCFLSFFFLRFFFFRGWGLCVCVCGAGMGLYAAVVYFFS